MREWRLLRPGGYIWRGVSTLSAALLVVPAFAAGAPDSPAGLWRVLDEKTGRLDALVRIYPAGNKLEGKLENIFPAAGEDQNPVCTKCDGERRDQSKRGMVFMWGFTRHDNEYTGGSILDPNTGSVYRAKLRLSDEGGKLILHGYIGIPLFGRSQTWLRAE